MFFFTYYLIKINISENRFEFKRFLKTVFLTFLMRIKIRLKYQNQKRF